MASLNSRLIPNSKWVPLAMHWKEKQEGGKELHHVYRPVLNTETGEIFTDNKISHVGKKCMMLIAVRPIHATIKTLYHLILPISIPREFVLAWKKEAQIQGANRNILHLIGAGMLGSVRSVLDILRTPLYGIELFFCAVIGAVLGMMGSDKVYDLRAIAGDIELELLWGNKESGWMRAPCFQPMAYLENFDTDWGTKTHADTNYEGLSPRERADANLARAVFKRRRNRGFYCVRSPQGVPLDSANYSTCSTS